MLTVKPEAWWSRARDPRIIGFLYLGGVTLIFLLGAAIAVALRLELLQAELWLMSADLFGRLRSAHGVLMLFLYVFPLFPGVLGNLLLPRTPGLQRFALPRINLAGALLYLAGGCLVLAAVLQGGADSTWMVQPELGLAGRHGGLLLVTGLLGVALGGVCLNLNLFVSLAAACRGWSGPVPYFGWSLLAASASWLLAAPIWIGLLLLRGMDGVAGMGLFEAASDPTLYRRLFLFFARPAFYAAMLPALGLTTELLDRRSARGCFSPRGVVAGFFLLAGLGHAAAMGRFTAAGFSMGDLVSSLAGYLTVVPAFLILGNWLACLRRLQVPPDPPLSFGFAFVILVPAGGLSGLILGSPAASVHLHGTLFSVAHLHLLLAGALTAAYLAGIHDWWQRAMPGPIPGGWAAVSAGLLVAGTLMTFTPQFILGSAGVPRRLVSYPDEFQVWHVLASAGAGLLLAGCLLPLVYLGCSLRGNRSAPADFRPAAPERTSGGAGASP